MMIVAIAVPVSIAACNKSAQTKLVGHVQEMSWDPTVIAFPPIKCPLANQVVEHKANDEPKRILGCPVSFWISKDAF
jgi:hypothetical protein